MATRPHYIDENRGRDAGKLQDVRPRHEFLRVFPSLKARESARKTRSPLLRAENTSKLKAGFIYVGPVSDFGWNRAHDEGRKLAEKALPWLETTFVESVPESEVESSVDQMARDGVKVVFANSFGYSDGILAAAKQHPDMIFAHATGFRRAPNVATYNQNFYQPHYLVGLIAGALSKTGKVGYVGAVPTTEIKCYANAYALGVQAANPKAKVLIRFTNSWYSPPAAKEATESLIAEGADAFCYSESSPTVILTAAEHKLISFSHYSPMHHLAPDYVASGYLVHWDKSYIDFLTKVHNGEYTPKNLQNVDFFGLLDQGGVTLGAKEGMVFNPLYVDRLKAATITDPVLGKMSAYDFILKRLAQMTDPKRTFDPFDGPLSDRKGVQRVAAKARLGRDGLDKMEWAAPALIGPWPNEP
ncbi:BMP family ABC transporter substrate-binding protein [uncultured Aquabacterium sp.]|uniref:BMP family ABC transporter substrate-binding protein n=1 Tax=uncultured Aquabacterium sp. TaxID=158753 RepID=UPI00261D9CBA|nr:BMP family ABC transporter substrate-binding protein [uncultured Aquabacterium sp.]